jgi:DNA ligase-1
VGDLAETAALLVAPSANEAEAPPPLHQLVREELLPLRALPADEQKARVTTLWRRLNTTQRLLFNKLITGAFRVGVGRTLVARALAEVARIPQAEMAHRLMGAWQPTAADYARLVAPVDERHEGGEAVQTRPYPFCLAYPIEQEPAALGPIDEWQIEWKWDGIRAQLIRRGDAILVWTRGEELVTDVYPELEAVGAALPSGTVIDGEILAWHDGPLPFNTLQKRLGRKKVTARLLSDAPVLLMAYDLLEWQGADVRARLLSERRALLEEVVTAADPSLALRLSPVVSPETWEEAAALRDESRARSAEGFMLKRREAPYGVGRRKGDWWKWKVDPFSVDAVLVYAQPGHGKRAGLFTDYTFAVWHEGELTPVAKAYSGLTDAEIREVDAFVRRNTLERFGPVRRVTPELVFEIGFEGIQPSPRHKSGVALRFPRMLRWRRDKAAAEADTLEALQGLMG